MSLIKFNVTTQIRFLRVCVFLNLFIVIYLVNPPIIFNLVSICVMSKHLTNWIFLYTKEGNTMHTNGRC